MRSYLVDGYNLIHALGLLNPQARTHALERSRAGLLHFLHESLGDEQAPITVVFDAAQAPPGTKPLHHFKGIEIRFAEGEADDLIEELILAQPQPRQLVVISNDHRLQQAARKSGGEPWSLELFLDHLEAKRRTRPAEHPAPPEKAERLTPEETQHWLREFGALADDPGFKEVFERYPFED